jgi:hypothetical protein
MAGPYADLLRNSSVSYAFETERAYNPAVPRAGWVVPLVVVLQLLVAGRAGANQCRAIDGATPALAAIDADVRLHWLDQRLAADAARARIWAWTWRAAYTGITIGEVVLAVTAKDTESRAAAVVGGASSFIGVAANMILPLKIMGDQSWWQKHYARSRNDDPCALVNTAEMLLVRGAESEAFGVGPLVHIGNFLINIAGGLVLGLGYDRWPAFAYTSLVGILVGELQVATQPTDAVEDLRLYRAGLLDMRPSRPRLGLAMAPIIMRDGGGAALTFRW